MKKIWNKPITWGNFVILSSASMVFSILYYIRAMYRIGINPCPKLTRAFNKLKVKICGKLEEDEP